MDSETLHDFVREYREAKRLKSIEYKRVYAMKPEIRERENKKALERYHNRKAKVMCEVCGKESFYPDRHKLTRRHLAKVDNGVEVIADQFEEIKPLIEEVVSAKQEVESIKQAISGGRVPPIYIAPIEPQKKASHKTAKLRR